jgi:hypothetical protein
MRTKHNLLELLSWCKDEPEGFVQLKKVAGRQQLSGVSTYIKPSQNAYVFPHDIELLEFNVFKFLPPERFQHLPPVLVVSVGFASIDWNESHERDRIKLMAKYFTCCHGAELIKYPPCDCVFKGLNKCSIPCFQQCTPYEGRSIPVKVNVHTD